MFALIIEKYDSLSTKRTKKRRRYRWCANHNTCAVKKRSPIKAVWNETALNTKRRDIQKRNNDIIQNSANIQQSNRYINDAILQKIYLNFCFTGMQHTKEIRLSATLNDCLRNERWKKGASCRLHFITGIHNFLIRHSPLSFIPDIYNPSSYPLLPSSLFIFKEIDPLMVPSVKKKNAVCIVKQQITIKDELLWQAWERLMWQDRY